MRQHDAAEVDALGPLDDLLVDGLRRVVHDDGAVAVVDLGVDAGVADEVDDPLFALGFVEAEAGGEVPSSQLAFCGRCAPSRRA